MIDRNDSGLDGTGHGRLRLHLCVDQALVAHAYRELLGRRSDHHVCGASRGPTGCLEDAPDEHADIVLFDLREAEHAGLAWIAELKRRLPRVRILMLREFLAPDYVATALNAGVDGALVRTEDPTEIFLAIDALRRGQGFLSRRLGMPGLAPDIASAERASHRLAAVQALDDIERRAFVELALGRGSAHIASTLQMDAESAARLELELRERLDCRSGAELTRLAIDSGVLPFEGN